MSVDYEEGRRLLRDVEAGQTLADWGAEIAAEEALRKWLRTHAEALLNLNPWRGIEEAPPHDMACLVCRSKAVFTDYKTGQPSSFGEVRDWAEKCEAAFWLNGQLHQAGTGHMYAEEDMSEEWQPTHWMPIPHFRELKGPK